MNKLIRENLELLKILVLWGTGNSHKQLSSYYVNNQRLVIDADAGLNSRPTYI